MSEDADRVFEDVSTNPRAPTTGMGPSGGFYLTVTRGPDRGAQLTFEEGKPARVVAGRGGTCTFRLDDPHASRRHVELVWDGEVLHLADLGSANGTTVNGVVVTAAVLRGGEAVTLGETTLHVVPIEAASAVRVRPVTGFGRMIGASAAMLALYPVFEKLARADVPLVVQGETGTGKELLAECLHQVGRRGEGPFVVLDCAAAPDACLDAVLFGEERDASAGRDRPVLGVFEQAHGGTLLLDEVADLPLAAQAKILRVIERSEVQRLGAKAARQVDVRIVATTKNDLDRRVREGRFREDLYYRLAVARVELPPLRKRAGDVALLSQHFWRRMGDAGDALPAEIVRRFEEHRWPGNVRELANAVARLRALREVTDLSASGGPNVPAPLDGAPIVGTTADAHDYLEHVLAQHLPLPAARKRVVAEFERRYVQRALAAHAGNVTRAARASGLATRYFQLLRARKIEPSE